MFCSVFESMLSGIIPVVKTSVGATRIIGRLCAGESCENKRIRMWIWYTWLTIFLFFCQFREQ
ncbi:alanine--tRNA ligase [Iris pallida]|uniref:Alanine--tRNA ligase n=1 Tax=Iris pallida TaxID=29817 RepID=A0AAX6DVX8_IRIPA|nr:alanine--tRNA ligase [Iris pallida]